jgi:tetrahydromethanopterin S-methyltransferase subunit G
MAAEEDGITLDTLAAMIKAGFDDVDKRFDSVSEEITTLRTELTEKIEPVDASLRVEIGALKQEMREGFVDVSHRLANIEDKLEDHEKRIGGMERELAP